jgi:hypothetical protein
LKKIKRDRHTGQKCSTACYNCDGPFLASREIDRIPLVSFLKINLITEKTHHFEDTEGRERKLT